MTTLVQLLQNMPKTNLPTTSIPDVDDLLGFIRKYPGCTLETLDEAKPFKVEVSEDMMVFFPNGGRGDERKVPLENLRAFLERMSLLPSPDARLPSSYKDASYNASYILGLVEAWEADATNVFVSRERRTQPNHLNSQQRDDLWEKVRRAVHARAKTREPGGRIAHGFEIEKDTSVPKLRWIASVYWSDNLPHNDIEIAVNLRRLSKSETELPHLRAWFEHAAEDHSSKPARSHSGRERDSFRAGFTYADALAFFEGLRKELSPMNRDPWALAGRKNWEWTVQAVSELGRATVAQVGQWISERKPGYVVSNARLDLEMLAVNHSNRSSYGQSKKPRRSDSGSPFDALYFDGTHYVVYSAALHGVWSLAPSERGGDTMLRPVLVELPVTQELILAEKEARDEGAFDPNDRTDARKKQLASIVRRRGQPKFRGDLLQAYDYRCAVSGCDAVHALEAAHITPYLGERTNRMSNGLLLRADLHTLFDLGLLWIEPSTMRVQLQSDLKSGSYAALHGVTLRLPVSAVDHPDPEALRAHIREVAIERSRLPIE